MTTHEGRHVGPIRTTEVLYSEGIYVERDPGEYVGRHRKSDSLTSKSRWQNKIHYRREYLKKMLMTPNPLLPNSSIDKDE